MNKTEFTTHLTLLTWKKRQQRWCVAVRWVLISFACTLCAFASHCILHRRVLWFCILMTKNRSCAILASYIILRLRKAKFLLRALALYFRICSGSFFSFVVNCFRKFAALFAYVGLCSLDRRPFSSNFRCLRFYFKCFQICTWCLRDDLYNVVVDAVFCLCHTHREPYTHQSESLYIY